VLFVSFLVQFILGCSQRQRCLISSDSEVIDQEMLHYEQRHSYDYYIDEHGNWFCQGNPVLDLQLFRLLSRSLFERHGHHFIRCEGEVHPVRVADAPLWIRYVHLYAGPQGELQRVEIELHDGRKEDLAAATLTTSQNHALYCRAIRRRLKARFGKIAYYELTRHLQMASDGRSFFFMIGGKRYDIRPE
jgi:uncharacterized protein